MLVAPTRVRYALSKAVFAACFAAAIPQAQSAVITVGSHPHDTTCQFTTIQAAVSHAAQLPGPDEIRISTSGTYTAQGIFISNQDLVVSGGYRDCWYAQNGWYEPHTRTTISGAGGSEATVFNVTGNGVREFWSLAIVGGDALGSSGGGISFFGGSANSAVVLRDTDVIGNRARWGGGISAGGQGALEIGRNVLIAHNTASSDGGGIWMSGNTVLRMNEDDASVFFNHAPNGHGGGLYIKSPARAFIGTPGYGGWGAFEFNDARDGGAVSVHSDNDDDTELHLYATDPARPVRLGNNRATGRGGAIFARGFARTIPFAIGHAFVHLDHFVIEANVAAEGAVAYLDHDSTFDGMYVGSVLRAGYNGSGLAAPCPQGGACNLLLDNQSSNGPVIRLNRDSLVDARRLTASRNRGAHLIHASGGGEDGAKIRLSDCLLEANSAAGGALLRTSGDSDVVGLNQCTITGNDVAAAHVVQVDHGNGTAAIRRSIIDQPGQLVLSHAGGVADPDIETEHNLASEVGSLSLFDGTSIPGTPRFVDAAYGDFRLRPGSRAVDFAPGATVPMFDLAGNARDRDLLVRPNLHGVRDLGAFELQPTHNLVMNGHFSGDDRAWNVTSEHAALDPFDASGSHGDAGRMSVRVRVPAGHGATQVTGLTQCIHVPGSGHYLLRGKAHTVAAVGDPEDIPAIEWRYHANTETCEESNAAGSGEMRFGAPDTLLWRNASEPTVISTATYGTWTPYAAIELRLRVKAGTGHDPSAHALYALFDDIELLSTSSPGGKVFANGFEPSVSVRW